MKKLLLILIMPLILMVARPYSIKAAQPEIYTTIRDAGEGLYEAVVSIRNNPGIAGYNLVMEFDNTILTPVSIAEGSALAGGMIFISNLMGAPDEDLSEISAVTAVWGAASDDNGNGVLFTVLFQASQASGSTELWLESRGIGNAYGQDVDFIYSGAVIDFSGVAFSDTNNELGVAAILIMGLSVAVVILVVVVVMRNQKRGKQPAMYKKVKN